MSNVNRTVDSCLLAIGGAYSLANIETVLGIIILCIQLTWIVAKIVSKIYYRIKNKEYPILTDDEVNKFIEELNDIGDEKSFKKDVIDDGSPNEE